MKHLVPDKDELRTMAKLLLKKYLYHNAKSNETVARKYVQRICCEC